jgi:hypothetical protein
MKKLIAVIAAVLTFALASYAASEIAAAVTLQASKGYFAYNEQSTASFDLTNATPTAAAGAVNVTTGAVTVSFQDVTKPGWSYFRNTSATNTILVTLTLRMQPGEFALAPLATNAVSAQIEAATVSTNEATSVLKHTIIGR